jgi:hypothetical protein
MAVSVCAWSDTHEKAFLSSNAPDQEVMSRNLKFSPVSVTMECILNLTLQFIVIYTALGICRSVLDFQMVPHSSSQVHTALKHASTTMFYAPMVCMLFVGYRMRMLQLSKGQGTPPEYVQVAMRSVAYSILANTLVVMLIPIFTSSGEVEVEATGEVKTKGSENPFANSILAFIFSAIRYLIVIGLYAGVGVVTYGIFTYEPPAGVWQGEIPGVSPAVGATVLLTGCFFLVYFFQAVARSYSQYVGGNQFVGKFETSMQHAADTMGMAPMLCALFLAARMRALQMDPVKGHPQRWAQGCFYGCAGAIVTQAIVAIVVPLLLNGTPKKRDAVEGDMEYDMGDTESWTSKGMTALRFVLMLSLYTGAIAVVCSVFTIEHPDGKDLTPPLSPTMQCVLNLAFQYFLIYALLWIFITLKDFTGYELTSAMQAIETAKSTVAFAPMIAVLFIATRMRALQMTDNKGAPQGWVQDGMYLATWSILLQFIMCLIMPFFTGKPYTPDTLDAPVSKENETNVSNYYGALAVTIVRYFALVSLLGGITTVAVGVFMMTPETANGRGAIPVIADGTIPGVSVSGPPGINDVPGAKGAMEGVGETVGAGHNAVSDAGDTVTGPVTDAVGA